VRRRYAERMADPCFPASVYASRLHRAAAGAAAAGIDALIIGPGPDLRYLTGSRASTFERLTALVVPAASEPTVVVPRMEAAALRESAIAELGLRVRDWVDGDDGYAQPLDAAAPNGTFAVSGDMPALHVIELADRSGTVPRLAIPVLRELRMVKDAAEIDALRLAGTAIDRVHARMGQWLRVGRTEREVAADIAAAILAAGHSAAEFVIVGSGPNAADPHHEVSDRVILDGDVVVVDIGGSVSTGYNSDSTRTYRLGNVPDSITRSYAVLQEAQQAAVDAVRPGATAGEVDEAARAVLEDAGLGENFIHRTGHGIGLAVHEEPYIVAGNDTVLRPGMTFSVEPGIYFPGEWGARIEDIVVVTDTGSESLNTRPRGLTGV
jgi:Xaa-Pro aminopeptidase